MFPQLSRLVLRVSQLIPGLRQSVLQLGDLPLEQVTLPAQQRQVARREVPVVVRGVIDHATGGGAEAARRRTVHGRKVRAAAPPLEVSQLLGGLQGRRGRSARLVVTTPFPFPITAGAATTTAAITPPDLIRHGSGGPLAAHKI